MRSLLLVAFVASIAVPVRAGDAKPPEDPAGVVVKLLLGFHDGKRTFIKDDGEAEALKEVARTWADKSKGDALLVARVAGSRETGEAFKTALRERWGGDKRVSGVDAANAFLNDAAAEAKKILSDPNTRDRSFVDDDLNENFQIVPHGERDLNRARGIRENAPKSGEGIFETDRDAGEAGGDAGAPAGTPGTPGTPNSAAPASQLPGNINANLGSATVPSPTAGRGEGVRVVEDRGYLGWLTGGLDLQRRSSEWVSERVRTGYTSVLGENISTSIASSMTESLLNPMMLVLPMGVGSTSTGLNRLSASTRGTGAVVTVRTLTPEEQAAADEKKAAEEKRAATRKKPEGK